MIFHDVIVVGGGLAGLRAAIEINKNNVKVGVISKVHPVRSHSIAAQGGINAALCNHPRGGYDSPEKHAFDTIKGSDYLADQDSVMQMTKDAPKRIYEMENWGCPFSRTDEGTIAQRPFGGAGFPRTAYGTDRTGHYLLHTLYEQAIKYEQASERGEFKMYDEWLATSLVIDNGAVQGIIAMNIVTGELEAFQADAVIFATGGSGRMYGNTTNAVINTGLGMAVPYWAGVPLKDMEFIQFHPTTLIGTNILMTEGCRGEGGFLLNNKGERFLQKYADSRKAMEVAPRDIVARNMTREIQAGLGFENSYLHLDLRHLGEARIHERLPGIRELCINFLGIDPVVQPIPVQPGMHYTMGGIDCNKDCETKIKGFYAAGEAACVSVHGANRLGGNSLLETIVFGAIAGQSAGNYVLSGGAKKNDKALEEALKKDKEKIQKLIDSKGKTKPGDLKNALQSVMKDKVGIFREEKSLSEALVEVKKLQEKYKDVAISYKGKRANLELMWTLELKGSLDVAEAVVAGALARKESRGSQFRTDYPQRDDKNWLKHTLAHFHPDGVKLDYSPVTLGFFEPKERKY
jgi:succinate dehydrogenase / fumarate reductase flavoprotein subunit